MAVLEQAAAKLVELRQKLAELRRAAMTEKQWIVSPLDGSWPRCRVLPASGPMPGSSARPEHLEGAHMLSRRSFLVSAGAGVAAGSMISSISFAAGSKIPLGIQLYTVRAETDKDVEGTLRKLYALGFREIEFAGYYKKAAADLGKLMKSIGFTLVSTHTGADDIVKNGDQIIADAKTLGLQVHHLLLAHAPKPRKGQARVGQEDGRARPRPTGRRTPSCSTSSASR